MKYICIKNIYHNNKLCFKKGVVYEVEKDNGILSLVNELDESHSFGDDDKAFFAGFIPFKFEIGDIVSHVLYDGELKIERVAIDELYPIIIQDTLDNTFTADGKSNTYNDKPSIHFIRRPSLEVKEIVEVVRYVNDENLEMIKEFSTSNIFMCDTTIAQHNNKITITFEK